jgi:hypothetical protein
MRNARIKYQKREKEILQMLKSGIKQPAIAEKFGLSKTRINQIALRNGYRAWNISRKNKAMMNKEMLKAIRNNQTIDEVVKYSKFDKETLYSWFNQSNSKSFTRIVREKRNEKITKLYKSGKTAKEIVTLTTPELLLNPVKLSNLNAVYRVTSKSGVKRFPMIKNRTIGGSNDSKMVLNFIKHSYEIKEWSFNKIAKELNKKGLKTVTGKKFTEPNTRVKYHLNKKYSK